MKPRILAFTRFYLPGYKGGGPIRTLANMASRLGTAFDFRVVTLNHDSGNTTPYDTVEYEAWTQVGKAKVMYMPPSRLGIRRLASLVTSFAPDVIYLNSFFDWRLTQRILWARRLGYLRRTAVVLAPRGEFSPGALAIKPHRKTFYRAVIRGAGLYSGLTWQASSEREKHDILRALPWINPDSIKVAMDLCSSERLEEVPVQERPLGAPLRICFLSRITPMKNLDFAIRALAQVKAAVHFSIYGPIEDSFYWNTCQEILEALPSHITHAYVGSIHPTRVHGTLSNHDLFLLPTRGENYGHVIHEALQAGLPALISDQTPWRDLNARGVGWTEPTNDPARFAAIIDDVATWPLSRLADVRIRAAEFAREHVDDGRQVQANIDLFLNLLGLS
jgi:glycosyltransferase involved in cell wall biosynthesis